MELVQHCGYYTNSVQIQVQLFTRNHLIECLNKTYLKIQSSLPNKKWINNRIVSLIVNHAFPFSVVEFPEFRELISKINPHIILN